MEGEQRGARENCSGTMDNLLVDRMVCQDSQRGRRNLIMAWVDVRKAQRNVRTASLPNLDWKPHS